ncbi:peptidoglycan-binding domain-containing protein [Streptomyces cavernicola]|uniref:Peptidoglycan-binding domain-containing protein n=1 Tax=Streptomyces cavernicola TaxID=3043613 RepID=A0ABT6SCH0_9ACTN|nr:peptidoglycan-binding domain-containing protein [Streptomyces sp. B-S-A6]MDI3405887.1 peptidoglycan-binding domain-containing protein [Streptomyces sp. B-S-A6]
MSARTCPQCGTPRTADGGPACGCTQRAADALREARSADAAAAEDFDLLRLRPYVSLPDAPDAPGTAEDAPADPSYAPRPSPHPAPRPAPVPRPADETLVREAAAGEVPATVQRRRPRRAALLAAGGAAVAVVLVTAVATGLFSGEPDQEHALPDHPVTTPATPRTTTEAPALTGTPSDAPKAAATASRSAAQRPTRSGTPTRTAPVTSAPPTVTASGSIGTPRSPAPPVLRAGDEGPEVRELQDRLRQRYVYAGPEHGSYDALVEEAVARYQYAEGVEGDPQGVYGPATRRALEAETEEPPEPTESTDSETGTPR